MSRTELKAPTLAELFEKIERVIQDRGSAEFVDGIWGSSQSSGVNSSGFNPTWDGKKWSCTLDLGYSISKAKAERKAAKEKAKLEAAKKEEEMAAAKKKKKEIKKLKQEIKKLEDS